MDDGERRKALTKFAREGRRAQPPVFVGRDAVIEDISAAAELAYEKWSSGSIDAKDPGLTRLVQGAPGAGKTALLRHLQERWQDDPEPRRPIAVRVSASALESPAEMHMRLRKQIPTTVMEKWGELLVDGLVKMAPGRGADALGPAAAVATKALREKAASVPATVVVMVDETQRVRPDSAAAATLQNLHEGTFGDIPMLPVFAGLGYLHSYLQQDGIKISRYSDDRRCVHTLGALKNSECLALLKEWLAHFGVVASPADLKRWGDALIRDTEGWPMHTSGFLAVLADDLAHSRDPANLASANLATARRVAAEDRAVYYNGRYEGVIQREVRWVGRAMAALAVAGGDLFEKDATAIIRGEGPPEGDAQAIFSALVERGFMQRQGTGLTFACPIPSLTSHAAIAATGNWKVNSAAAVGSVDELWRRLADGGEIEGHDALGRTPLRIAAECRWADVARNLLEAGADADAPDSIGTTPREAWPEFEWPEDDPPPSGQKRRRKRPGAPGRKG